MKKGFTLVELMITVSLIMVITIGALANYFLFDTRQRVAADVKKFLSTVNEVRLRAQSLEYPPSCSNLQSYKIVALPNMTDLEVYVNCSGVDTLIDEIELLEETVFDTLFSLSFLSQSGYLEIGENVEVVIKNKNDYNDFKTVVIDAFSSNNSRYY